jgi:plastocyanin
MVVLRLRELGEPVHEPDRLAEVGEAEATLERAAHLVPALGIPGGCLGQSGHGRESYHTDMQPLTSRKLALVVSAAMLGALATGAAATAKTYYGVVGPGQTIVLKNAAGKKVTRIKKGQHRIKVNDKSAAHNFHLIGPGINKKTRVPFVGKRTWVLTFSVGKYRYRCDPHRQHMRGSFRVVA